MKPYKFTDEFGRRYDTRHEAIKKASIGMRKQVEYRQEIDPDYVGSPEERRRLIMRALDSVHAYEPHICGFCKETFLYEDDHREHQPCPEAQIEDDPQHSNPVEWHSVKDSS